MNVRLGLLRASAALLITTGVANESDTQIDHQPAGRAFMEQSADESAQSSTDMSYGQVRHVADSPTQATSDTSYGGVFNIHSETGSPHIRTCSTGIQCNGTFGQ